jgi:hypothetical protein
VAPIISTPDELADIIKEFCAIKEFWRDPVARAVN